MSGMAGEGLALPPAKLPNIERHPRDNPVRTGYTSLGHPADFPASDLPTNPVDRFGDLFRTKSRLVAISRTCNHAGTDMLPNRWRAEELTPFLQGIAVDQKERDKMLVKFTRTSTDAKGVKWYSARANH